MEQGYRSGGREGALRKGIETVLAQRKAGEASAYSIATMYAELGEKDQALRWLNTSFEEREQDLLGLKTDSSFDLIRSDPRFAELVRKVGLPQGTQSPEAYELYLKGRACLEKRTLSDLKTAVSYFDQAIARDPGYALAYVGLAHVYAVLPDYGDSAAEDHPKAMSAARKALELDPDLSEPHAVLGGQMMAQDWNFSGGIAELKKAVELDPNNAEVRRIYADNVSLIGGMEQEAITEVNRAHQLDPQSRLVTSEVGQVYIAARQFDEAIAVLKKLANENPTYPDAHLLGKEDVPGGHWRMEDICSAFR
jgi:tetratricopeptide (TPR) repeat protein